MVEDHEDERLTEVVEAQGPMGGDDDPIGMRVGRGTEVGGYIIDGELGHGGMGVVYSATHPVIGKRAAIKILRPDVSCSPVSVERFIQEARAVNQIGHPNIVDIFAYGALPDGRAYHVMDLLDGESLRRRLKRGVLHPSEAASVIDEISQALTAAHDHGFVHRDLKPDNVFLVHRDSEWPGVKLLDFGLAKLMPEHGAPAITTKAGVMLGTPEYMSPEQARGTGVDYRTDLYALGIVMFEILAGTRPFEPLGDSLATLMQHAEEPPRSLADVVPGLPDEMVQLVAAMLAKTPEARPSLAAVRTVIKRLRTTQLPTRSVAGLEVAAMSQYASAHQGQGHGQGQWMSLSSGIFSGDGLTASRVGAEARLPGDPRSHMRDANVPVTVDGRRRSGSPSHPPSSPPHPPSSPSHLPPSHPPSSPPPSSPPPSSYPAMQPSSFPQVQPSSYPQMPLAPLHGHGPGPAALSATLKGGAGVAPVPMPQPFPRTRTPSNPQPPAASNPALRTGPAGQSQNGLNNSANRMPATTLGVGPVPALTAPPTRRRRRGWVLFALLLMIAAGLAVVIALT